MNRISFALATVSALAIMTPLAAQTSRRDRIGAQSQPRHRQTVADLRMRLDTGIARGTITRREATTLRIDLDSLVRLGRIYGRDGFSRRERETLMRRGANLRWFIQRAEENATSDRL